MVYVNLHKSCHFILAKQRNENTFGIPDDESSLDVSSPREINSPSVSTYRIYDANQYREKIYIYNYFITCSSQFGILSKSKDGDKLTRKKDKQKAKEDEKLEKRRQKEEKLKKHAEKEKEREKKKQEKIKQMKGGTGGTPISGQLQQPLIEDFAQSESNRIPLFLEKCVRFIEDEGLDSEGIYRVPGNRAHVELLFQKFEEGISFIETICFNYTRHYLFHQINLI